MGKGQPQSWSSTAAMETQWKVLLFEQLGLGEDVPAQCKEIGLDGLLRSPPGQTIL